MKTTLAIIITSTLATHAIASGPCTTDDDCDDQNPCTRDRCFFNGTTFFCRNLVDYNDSVYCCNTSTGELAFLFDDDLCTPDSCDDQGNPVHDSPIPNCDNTAGQLLITSGNPASHFDDPNFVPTLENSRTIGFAASVLLNDVTLQDIAVGIPCAFYSDDPALPPVEVLTETVRAASSHSSWVLGSPPGGIVTFDPGQCDEIPCASDPTVCHPAGEGCLPNGYCQLYPPQAEHVAFAPGVSFDQPRRVILFNAFVPFEAVGEYNFHPICCVDDEDCDGVNDGGCPGGMSGVLTRINVGLDHELDTQTTKINFAQNACSPDEFNDNNACTMDRKPSLFSITCPFGFELDEFDCCRRPIYDTERFCCDPDTGEIVAQTDHDPCTADSCDGFGNPVHTDISSNCGPEQPSLFFVPAGVDLLDVLTNPNFQHTVDPGTVLTVEVYYAMGGESAQEFSVQLPCDYFSDEPAAPPLHLIADSPDVNTNNSFWVGNFGVGFPAVDEGQCNIRPCVLDTDCPGGSMCIGDFCPIISPRVSYTGLLGPIGAGVPPLYIGEAQYDIPIDARGQYTVRSECCVADADCDGTFDAGCALDQTNLDSGNTPIDLVTPLIVNIQIGDCLVGNTCTADLTRPECEVDLGGTFRPDGNCGCFNNDECNDNDPCTTDTCVDIGSLCPNGTKPDFLSCCNLNQTPADFCCDATTGQLRLRTDSNACTIDTCNPTGQSTHTPIPDCDINEPIPTLNTWGQAAIIITLAIGLVVTVNRLAIFASPDRKDG